MKNNSKNRKLTFIREKNDLRLGKTIFVSTQKVSNEVLKDIYDDDYKNIIENFISESYNKLYKKYKLVLRNQQLLLKGYCDDDFIKNIHTNMIKLSN